LVQFFNLKVIIGPNGYPIIFTLLSTYPVLFFCEDILCHQFTRVNFYQFVSSSFDIIIGSDGLILMSIFDAKTKDAYYLHVVHCETPKCSKFSDVLLDGPFVGWFSKIHIGSNGLPIITYLDNEKLNIKIAACTSIQCSTYIGTVMTVEGGVYILSSILGVDGNLLHIYSQNSTRRVFAAYCMDLGCQNVTTSSIGWNSSTRINTIISGDGKPIISTSDTFGHCQDIHCSSITTQLLDGNEIYLTTDIAGFPFLVTSGFELTSIRCTDFACNYFTTTTTSSSDIVLRASVTLGADGLPFIAFTSFNKTDGFSTILKCIHCGNSLCTRWGV